MLRKYVTVIELVIIVFVLGALGYKFYKSSQEADPFPPGTKTRTVPFHNGSATMPTNK